MEMRKFQTLLLAVLFSISFAASQVNVKINSAVDLNNNSDKDKALVFNLWKDYLTSRPDSIYNLPQWNDVDKQKYKCPDLLQTEGFLTPGLYNLFYMGYTYKALEIRRDDDGKYVIRAMLFFQTNDNDIFVLGITNHVVKKDCNGEYKLFNWVDEYSREWTHKRVGCIDYIYYPGYQFDEEEAQKANNLISFFKNEFDIGLPDRITYYIARNCDDIFCLKGFDYIVGMGNHMCNTCGFTDRVNSIIYADAFKGANYQHEFCRLINPSFPNAHSFMIQGIAEFFNTTGEQLGYTHKEHYANMLAYLDEHPDIDIKDADSPFYIMDSKTAPSYLVGKIICDELYKKGGYSLIKQGLETNENEFFDFLKKAIGVSEKKFNGWIYGKIKQYAQD